MKLKDLREKLGKMSGSKLTGQEITVYMRKNPGAKKDVNIRKGVEFALDHGGAMTFAIKGIEKIKRGLSKHPEVKKALQYANESTIESMKEDLSEDEEESVNEARITISTPMYSELEKFGLSRLMKKHDAYLNKNETDSKHTTISTPSPRFHKEIQNLIKKNLDKLAKVLEGKEEYVMKKGTYTRKVDGKTADKMKKQGWKLVAKEEVKEGTMAIGIKSRDRKEVERAKQHLSKMLKKDGNKKVGSKDGQDFDERLDSYILSDDILADEFANPKNKGMKIIDLLNKHAKRLNVKFESVEEGSFYGRDDLVKQFRTPKSQRKLNVRLVRTSKGGTERATLNIKKNAQKIAQMKKDGYKVDPTYYTEEVNEDYNQDLKLATNNVARLAKKETGQDKKDYQAVSRALAQGNLGAVKKVIKGISTKEIQADILNVLVGYNDLIAKMYPKAMSGGKFKSGMTVDKMIKEDTVDENYRTLARKGMGAETRKSIKVGTVVDFYDNDGNKREGKIIKMGQIGDGYTLKDVKSGKVYKFTYHDRMKAKKLLRAYKHHESTAAWAKSLEKIKNQRQLDKISDKDKATLKSIMDLLNKEKKKR